MSTASRVIKNTGFLYIKMAITIVVSLYSTRIILQALGASDFGIYTIVGGAIGMLGFLNSTMANATQRFMSYAEGEGNEKKKLKIFNVSLILHVVIAVLTALLLLVAFFPLFNGILNIEPERLLAAKIVFISLVISTILTIVNVPYDAIMNAHENMLYYSIVGIVESILKLGVAFACRYSNGDKLILYGILMTLIPLFTLSIMKVYCHRHYSECRFAIKSSLDIVLLKEITLFSGWNFLTAISNLISGQGIGIVLNHFFGTTLNAAHGIAHQVNSQLCAFAVNMRKALNPVIVKSAGARDVNTMNKASLMGCKYSTLLTSFFAIPLILEMQYVLTIWLKNVPDWAVLFCRLQLLQSIITQLAGSVATSIYAHGKIKEYAIWKSIMNLLPIFVTYICFWMGGDPFWLYVPMMLIWGVGGDVIILYYAKRLCNLPTNEWFRRVLFPVTTIIILMIVFGYSVVKLLPSSFIRLMVCCSATSVILVGSLWIVGLSNKEKNIVVYSLKKITCQNKAEHSV